MFPVIIVITQEAGLVNGEWDMITFTITTYYVYKWLQYITIRLHAIYKISVPTILSEILQIKHNST